MSRRLTLSADDRFNPVMVQEYRSCTSRKASSVFQDPTPWVQVRHAPSQVLASRSSFPQIQCLASPEQALWMEQNCCFEFRDGYCAAGIYTRPVLGYASGQQFRNHRSIPVRRTFDRPNPGLDLPSAVLRCALPASNSPDYDTPFLNDTWGITLELFQHLF